MLEMATALADLLGVRLSKERQPDLAAQYREVGLRNTGYFLYVDRSLDYKTVFRLKSQLESILADLARLEAVTAEHALLHAELQEVSRATRTGSDLEEGIEHEFDFLRDFEAEYALWWEGRLVVNSGLDPFTLETSRQRLARDEAFRVSVKKGEFFGYKTEVFSLVVLSARPLSQALQDVLRAKLWWLTRAYRQATSELEVIFHTFPDVYVRLDADGVILDYKAHPSIHLPSELVGRSIQDVAPLPEIKQQFAQAIRQVQQTRSLVTFEYPFIIRGRRYFHEARLAPLHKSQIVAILRDVTRRKEAEIALRQSEEDLRILMEQTPVGILTVDMQGRVTDANPRALELLGSPSREETIGLNVLTLPTLVAAGYSQAFERVLETGEPEDMEGWYTSIWGEKRYLQAHLVPHYDGQGRQIGVIQILEDMTERVQGEAQIRKLYEAVEQSANGVVIVDREGRIEFVNQAFTRITGYSAQEAIGQDWSMVKSDYHSPEFYREMRATYTRGDVWKGELVNKRKNGELYWEANTISPIRNAAGEITHYLSIKEDISERKQMEEELRRLFDEAQQAKEAALRALRFKSRLLAIVSHDLRSPLGAILGYAEMIQDGSFGPLSEKQRDVMTRVVENTRYLSGLVSDLLDQAQLEAESIQLDHAPFDPKDMARQVVDRMQVKARAKGLALTLEIAADAPATWIGDQKRLQQVLTNLVDNAIKFTEAGEVQVRLYRSDPGHWAMQVADTGPGIAPEAQAYIFDPFRQVDDPTIKKHAGVGLGLSIARQLVEMMGGEITLVSEPGQGSTFTVRLPLTPSP